MKIECYLNGKIVKRFYDVKSIHYDYKYNYWVLTQRIYHYDIITIHRPIVFDKVIAIDKEGIRKEITI